MSKKSILLILVLLFISLGTLMAVEAELQPPSVVKVEQGFSVFDIGIINKMPFNAITEADFTKYIPGIRLQWNVLSWFGVAADIEALSYDFDGQKHDLALGFTAILRAPIKFVEPYLGIGSSSGIHFEGGNVTSPANLYRVHLKTGVDFNILKWLGLGVEATLWTPDPVFFFENMTGDLLLDHLDLGVNVKFRF
ncbi:MAG: hypothetical protein PHR10_09240 [Sphaerochaetaceae bacterium]|nr:hypothetical protein [Sphaerochaetaceae bacterium]